MPSPESHVTQEGRVTIPASVRRHLGLKPRDRVRFEIEDGAVRMTWATSKVLEIYGSVTPLNRPENFTALREEFEAGVAREAMQEDR